MSIPETQCNTSPLPGEARERARTLWLNRARAYEAHVHSCDACRWGEACPAEASLNALCAEAWDALQVEHGEER